MAVTLTPTPLWSAPDISPGLSADDGVAYVDRSLRDLDPILRKLARDQSTIALAVVTTLAGLSDVLIAAPSNGQVLSYDSGTGKWKNLTISSGGGGSGSDSFYLLGQ